MNPTVPLTMANDRRRQRQTRRIHDPLGSSSHHSQHSIELDGVEHDVSNLFDPNECLSEFDDPAADDSGGEKVTLTLYPSVNNIPEADVDIGAIIKKAKTVVVEQNKLQHTPPQPIPEQQAYVGPSLCLASGPDDGFRELEQQAFPSRAFSEYNTGSGSLPASQQQNSRMIQPIPESTTVPMDVSYDIDVRSTTSGSTDSAGDDEIDAATPDLSQISGHRRATRRARRRRARRVASLENDALPVANWSIQSQEQEQQQQVRFACDPAPSAACDHVERSNPSESVYTTSIRSMSAMSDDSYSPNSARSVMSNFPEGNPTRNPITGEELKMMEITPGQFLPVRGASETEHAIQCGEMQAATCTSCTASLFCMVGAQLVLCPTCRVVGPILYASDGQNSSNKKVFGVGLGLTHGDMDEMKRFLGVN